MNTIVVVPVYNEEATVVDVLRGVERHADMVVVVDDASTDATPQRLREWMGRALVPATCLRLERNRGAAGALGAGFRFVCAQVAAGRADPDDAVVTLDADGQHLPGDIDRLVDVYRRGGWDHVLGRRDFSAYPGWKRLGNRLMTLLASTLARRRFQDVECGFRLLRAGALADIMRHYTGYRYSNGQEIAIISSLCGHRVTNDCPVRIAFYRNRGARAWDGVVAAYYGARVALRTRLRQARRPEPAGAPARGAVAPTGDG